MAEWRFKVLFDGECPFCRLEARWLSYLNRSGCLAIEDIAAPDFEPSRYGSTLPELMGTLHGVFPDGRKTRGVETFREAYRAVGLGWLLAPTGWPVLRQVFDALYVLFARYRVRLGARSGGRVPATAAPFRSQVRGRDRLIDECFILFVVGRCLWMEKTADTSDPKLSSAPSETEELPLKLEADFAPLREADTTDPADRSDQDPHHEESLRVQEAFELATQAAAAGDEDRAVRQYLKASNLAEAAREWYLAAVSCQRVADFLQNPKPPEDLERAFRMYRRAVAAYELCGLFDDANRLSYRLMCLRLSRARQLRLSLMARIELVLYWAMAGFGYRPRRIIGSAVAVVIVYGLLYWVTNGVVTAGATPRNAGFWECVYFSGITFATVGYGDFIPAPHMRLLALTEGALGVFTMGFFVVVLAKNLRH